MVCSKLVIAVIFVFGILLPSALIAQENSIVAYKEFVGEGKITYLPIYNRHNLDTRFELSYQDHDGEESGNSNYIMNWNNQVFNTYRDEKLTYPFELNFEDDTFSPPVDHKMLITSRYGWRRGRAHRGIDIDLVTGDNVKSILDGKVRYVNSHSGHGKTVVIRHYNGLETVYAHLSKYSVAENDLIKKGQIIGKGGVSGNARGSHLHLEVRYHGKSINPEYLFDFVNEGKIRASPIYITHKWVNPRSHKSTRLSKILVYTDQNDIPTRAEQKRIYTVKKGDTLYRIANRHDINVSEICKLNAIRTNAILNIGQEILIN